MRATRPKKSGPNPPLDGERISCDEILKEQEIVTQLREDRDHINFLRSAPLLAHNFGDTSPENYRTDIVPQIAGRVKTKLNIRNRKTEPGDVIFGCPGWIKSLHEAHIKLQAGYGTRALALASEILHLKLTNYLITVN